MKSIGIKFLVFIGAVLSLSSCMMMGPGHMASSHHNQTNISETEFYDPVCGNHIDSVNNNLSHKYKENIYYFHSEECMSDFKKHPKSYISTNNQGINNQLLWGMGGISMGAMMILMLFIF